MERCPGVLLMCWRATIYLSSYTIYVSAYTICVLIYALVLPPLILLYVVAYCYVSSYVCVLILLYAAMEERPGVATPLTAVYVFAYYYVCVLMILHVCVLIGCETAMANALGTPKSVYVFAYYYRYVIRLWKMRWPVHLLLRLLCICVLKSVH